MSFEVKPAPGTWKWDQEVVGWMVWEGDRQVAWFADEKEARATAEFLGLCRQGAKLGANTVECLFR